MFNFGETPEGVPFLEISEEIGSIRFLQNGVIETYTNGKLTSTLNPNVKLNDIKPQPFMFGDFEIRDDFLGRKIVYKPKEDIKTNPPNCNSGVMPPRNTCPLALNNNCVPMACSCGAVDKLTCRHLQRAYYCGYNAANKEHFLRYEQQKATGG